MPTTRLPDKRQRLVDAAGKLFYRQGFGRTTLAHIAAEADVPLGNVYYYFKTKDALGEALVEQRLAEYRARRARWEKRGDARERLACFVQMTIENRRQLARSGCPIGSFCSELHKQPGPLPEQASRLFADWLEWLEDQFRALGKGDESGGLAVHVLSVLQGATLLTHSFGDPAYIEAEARRLMDWIDSL
ncbi:MAG: TetR/AcrR family transcriptional regulator [Actinomycetota bacterium]|jgi:TetR/AcrR family transcriptional regulator, transcriptional repressor for nem operon